MLALILFSVIDLGMLFGGYTTMRGGVEAAARQASVNEYTPPSGTCSGGTSAATADMVCTAAYDIGRLLSVSANSLEVGICFLPTGGTCASEETTQTGAQCTASSNGSGDDCEVEICAQAAIRSTTGVTSPFLDGRTLSTASVVRLELGTLASTSFTAFNASSTPVTYDGASISGVSCT